MTKAKTDAKKRGNKLFSLVFTAALICLVTAAIIPGVNGASAVYLGSAGNYAILTKTGISTTGTTSINGNIGVSPIVASAITGFGLSMDPSNQFSRSSLVNGGVYAANYAPPTPATMTTAVSNMETAYTSAAGQVPPDATELYAGNLGGKSLAPGVYKWSSGVLIPTATKLTLDGKGNSGAIWVFQVAGDLTMNSGSSMVLANGAQANNVYWQVAGPAGVILGSGAHAEGNLLSQKAITMNSGASLNGRALAQSAVTMIASTVTSPSPSSVPAQSTGGTGDNSYNTGTTQTLAPGQTATPSQTAVPTSTPQLGLSRVKSANVGGDTAIDSVEVLGTGHSDLIVTGARAYDPGTDFTEAPGTVFQYLDLNPARYSTIEQAKLAFNVPNSWLDSKHIPTQNLVVYALNGVTWTALPTSFVKLDGTVSRYTVVAPGLSTRFAIAGQSSPTYTPIQTPVTMAQYTQTPRVTDAPIVYTSVATPQITAVTAQPSLAPTQSPLPVWVPGTAVIGTLLIIAVFSGRSGKKF